MKTKTLLSIFALLLALAAPALSDAAPVTLLFDDFAGSGLGVGDGTSVNGGFQLMSNASNGTGAVGETPSDATIVTAANDFDTTGIVSINSVDTSVLTNLSATWNISSQTGAGASGPFRRTMLALQSATSNGTGNGSGFLTTPRVLFELLEGGVWALSAHNGTADSVLFNGPSVVGGVPDGYTISLDLDEDGWEVSGTGFTTPPTASGLWPTAFDFSDLPANLFASAMIQTDQNATAFLNIDSITLSSDVNLVPEPTSIALAVMGLLMCGMIGWRRRHR